LESDLELKELKVSEYKDRLDSTERKYDELLTQYHKHEESLQSSSRQQQNELRHILNKQYQDELAKLNAQLLEVKDKGKRKQSELTIQIND
jgi:capsule polysaccharide export protein KpsE/RkpR